MFRDAQKNCGNETYISPFLLYAGIKINTYKWNLKCNKPSCLPASGGVSGSREVKLQDWHFILISVTKHLL